MAPTQEHKNKIIGVCPIYASPSKADKVHVLKCNLEWKVLFYFTEVTSLYQRLALICFPAGLRWEIACSCRHVMLLCPSSFHMSNASSVCPLAKNKKIKIEELTSYSGPRQGLQTHRRCNVSRSAPPPPYQEIAWTGKSLFQLYGFFHGLNTCRVI